MRRGCCTKITTFFPLKFYLYRGFIIGNLRFMIKHLFIAVLFFFSGVRELAGQNSLGLPHIINYNNTTYKGGRQNWSIAQDKDGILYFGNNEGLLTFDGRYWQLYPLPNATVVRSVCIADDGTIYVGGQDEIGYFTPNELGVFTYHSLLPLLPESERSLSDVWDIEMLGDNVFFRTTTRILHYFNGRILVDKTPTTWHFLGKAGEKVYAQNGSEGLFVYENQVWKPLANHPLLEEHTVSSILPHGKDTLLITTLKAGLFYLVNDRIFPAKTDIDPLLYTHRVYCSKDLGKGRLALGTTSSGLFITDYRGQVSQKFTYEQGLQNNYIRDIFLDRDNNLWLALDYGIDYISLNSAIHYIYPDKENPVSSYGVSIFKQNLYIATSNGLYSTPVITDGNGQIRQPDTRFYKVAGSDGQVWGLGEINGRLLMSHEDGGFEVTGHSVAPIYKGIGSWQFRGTSRILPVKHLISGTYNGLNLTSFSEDRFGNEGHIENSSESLRFIHYDDPTRSVWASHPNRGVFRLVLSQDLRKVVQVIDYSIGKGLPSVLHNYLFYIRNTLLVTQPEGVFEYDRASDSFRPAALYEPLKGLAIQYMTEGPDGNVWFITHKKPGVMDFNRTGNSPSVIYFPELNTKVLGGFESVYIYNNENVFFGAEKGVIVLNYRFYQEKNRKPNVLLRSVRAMDHQRQEKVLFGGYTGGSPEKTTVKYTFNSFQFTFTSPLYDQQDNILFSYMLEGADKTWSAWNNKSEKEYTNLPAGNYLFKVKSRNGIGNESEIVTYSFSVHPPWFATTFSYFVYFILFLLLMYYLLLLQNRKLKQKHDHELHLQQLELQKKEKEVMRLRTDRLEADINFKDKELANMTMHLVQRGEILSKIKENIVDILKKQEQNSTRFNFRQLLRLIKDAERTNEDWEQFNRNFNNAHEGFFLLLKEEHPDLTAHELRLCALLRMNLLSKEIAQIMHVSVKAVEISRYRLRKKLKLDPEVNLHEYLSHYAQIQLHKTAFTDPDPSETSF